MSSRKSTLSKILRAQTRREKRRKTLVEKNRRPGETDEQMLERQKKDLFGYVEMMDERDVEEVLTTEAERLKGLEDMQQIREEEN